MFLFCVHTCVWVGKKTNWRLEVMQSIETSGDSVGHLKKTWCTSLKPVNILLAGTPKMYKQVKNWILKYFSFSSQY